MLFYRRTASRSTKFARTLELLPLRLEFEDFRPSRRMHLAFECCCLLSPSRIGFLLEERDSSRPRSSLLLLKAFACAASHLLQNLLREHTPTAEFNPFAHQLKQHVFAFLVNCSYVLQIDNESAAVKVCSRFLVRSPEFRRPRPDDLALQNQAALSAAVKERDLQHCFFPLAIRQGAHQTCGTRNSLNFRETTTRSSEVSRLKKLKGSKLSMLR
jgi:hypothetical protein